METYSPLAPKDESYFSVIPKEIVELIIYRLNNDDLQSFILNRMDLERIESKCGFVYYYQ